MTFSRALCGVHLCSNGRSCLAFFRHVVATRRFGSVPLVEMRWRRESGVKQPVTHNVHSFLTYSLSHS
eukprot:g25687.t1